MTDSSFILFFILVAIVFIAAAIYSYHAAKKRREELFALGMRLGLEFSQYDLFDIEHRYSQFNCFNQGHNRKAYNVLHGRIGDYNVKAFDYEYYTTEGSGKSRHEQRHVFSAVIFDTNMAFDPLVIRPEGFLDKIAGAIGFDDIDFESNEFSRMFYVKCGNKKRAYDIIHPRMMEYLMQHHGWSTELDTISVLVHSGSTLSALEFESAIEYTKGFLALFPDYLVQELRGDRRTV